MFKVPFYTKSYVKLIYRSTAWGRTYFVFGSTCIELVSRGSGDI